MRSVVDGSGRYRQFLVLWCISGQRKIKVGFYQLKFSRVKMALHERHRLFFLEGSFILILSIGYVVGKNGYAAGKNIQPPYTCGGGVVTPGYTYPLGDITLEYGNSLEILCVLHDNKAKKFGLYPSRLMSIKWMNRTQPTDIVNSTAIRLYIDKPTTTNSADYSCYVNGTFVCHNVVVVGSKPKNVTDFKCIGYNYENLTCTWTPPENFVTTDYHLEYSPSSRPTRTAQMCPQIMEKENKEINIKMLWCTWNFSTRPQYRHSHEQYRFALTANNTFGNVTWLFNFDHYPHVVPNAPENLTAIATSPHSIRLTWLVPIKMQSFPGGIVHRISWWIKGYNNWTTKPLIEDEKIERKIMVYDLDDLPYAHCLYDIRVSMKSLKATDESLWSHNSSVTVWTRPKLPERPPRTNIGSFEILQSDNRIVYWQKINDYEENGENFSYHIEVDGHPNYKPSKVNSNYARFENLTNNDYTFKIWSKNDLGRSTDYSVVFMPSPSHALKPPSKLVKVDRGHGQYDLEWVESPDVENYTLFWCLDPKDRPYQCDGVMNWVVIPKGSNSYNLRLPEVNEETHRPNNYQFAISANGYGISSGMLWAECTVIPGRGTKLSQIYVKNVDSRSITIVWKLECFKRGDVSGFSIKYCPLVSSPESVECKNNTLQNKLIEQPDVEEGVIQGLTPYTRYKINVKPLLTNGIESQFSEPMINLTLQDAPSEPKNLRIINKSESSMTIEWEKPERENGVITHYNILVDGDLKKTINSYKNSNVYLDTIMNLTSRTDYNISVKACVNTMCSEALIRNKTEIGYPGTIPKPSGNWDNHSLVIKWDHPNPRSVEVDYYEVLIETSNKEEIVKKTVNVTETAERTYLVDICSKDKSQSVFVNIRAVNILAGKALKGPWSEQAYFPCFRSPSSATWVIIIIIVSVIFFVGLMIYLTKQLCSYIKIMSDVPVKLPDGLLAVMETYQEKEKHIDDTLPPDKPLLSKQFQSQPRNQSGESSGCCSGTESVSSSVESAGHLSMSDSGTEQPISPCLGDSEGSVALRQRPNVKKTDYVTMPEITQSSWSPKQTQGGYSVIGMAAPPKKPDSEHEYMVLSDLPSKSSYVPFPVPQTQDSSRESPAKQTSGYVPYMTQEPAAKNTDYVLAGVPTKQTMPLPKVPSSYTTQKEEPSSGYVKAPPMIIEAPKLLLPWQQQSSVEPPPTGYVVVGDPKPQKTALDMPKGTKGYVPHNIKFDTTKSLKED